VENATTWGVGKITQLEPVRNDELGSLNSEEGLEY